MTITGQKYHHVRMSLKVECIRYILGRLTSVHLYEQLTYDSK